MDLVGLFYFSNIFIGRTLYRLQLLLHLQCFCELGNLFLAEGF
jgi:hypothetical protein